jgi:4'-phosphopantetheinyl transferase
MINDERFLSMTAARPVAVDLWVWSLAVDEGERARLDQFLSDEEHARANRFVFARDRERFVVAHGALRDILGRRLGVAPGALRFSISEHGKPALKSSVGPFHFNLTHSEDLAALATAPLELGVDIEFIRPLKEDVAERFFSKREIAALAALPAEDQLTGFYRCWTRKEAIVKAIGEGLSHALDSFDVSVAAGQPAIVERWGDESDTARQWRLANFEPAPGFAGAIACLTNGSPLDFTMRRWGAGSALL